MKTRGEYFMRSKTPMSIWQFQKIITSGWNTDDAGLHGGAAAKPFITQHHALIQAVFLALHQNYI
jgi:hypothetical protein